MMETNYVGEKRKGPEDTREDSKRQKTMYSAEEIRALLAEVAALKEENAKLDQRINQVKGIKSEKDIDDELKDMFSSDEDEDVTNPSTPSSVRTTVRRTTPTRKPQEVSPALQCIKLQVDVEMTETKPKRSTSANSGRRKQWQPVLPAPAWEKKRTGLVPRLQDPFALAKKVLQV